MAAVVLAVALVVIQPPPSHPVEHGLFSQYARGPTDDQIWYHETQTKLLSDYEDYDGFIAVLDCKLVGGEAWISINGSPWKHVFVGDCSGHSSTTQWMLRANIIAEIDYYLKEELGVPDLRAARGMITWKNPNPNPQPQYTARWTYPQGNSPVPY